MTWLHEYHMLIPTQLCPLFGAAAGDALIREFYQNSTISLTSEISIVQVSSGLCIEPLTSITLIDQFLAVSLVQGNTSSVRISHRETKIWAAKPALPLYLSTVRPNSLPYLNHCMSLKCEIKYQWSIGSKEVESKVLAKLKKSCTKRRLKI